MENMEGLPEEQPDQEPGMDNIEQPGDILDGSLVARGNVSSSVPDVYSVDPLLYGVKAASQEAQPVSTEAQPLPPEHAELIKARGLYERSSDLRSTFILDVGRFGLEGDRQRTALEPLDTQAPLEVAHFDVSGSIWEHPGTACQVLTSTELTVLRKYYPLITPGLYERDDGTLEVTWGLPLAFSDPRGDIYVTVQKAGSEFKFRPSEGQARRYWYDRTTVDGVQFITKMQLTYEEPRDLGTVAAANENGRSFKDQRQFDEGVRSLTGAHPDIVGLGEARFLSGLLAAAEPYRLLHEPGRFGMLCRAREREGIQPDDIHAAFAAREVERVANKFTMQGQHITEKVFEQGDRIITAHAARATEDTPAELSITTTTVVPAGQKLRFLPGDYDLPSDHTVRTTSKLTAAGNKVIFDELTMVTDGSGKKVYDEHENYDNGDIGEVRLFFTPILLYRPL